MPDTEETNYQLAEQAVKMIAVAVAALWTLFLYYDHRHDRRAEQTLKYVERFHDEKMEEARAVTQDYWRSIEGTALLFAHKNVELRAPAVNRVRSQNLEHSVSKAYEFYAEVALCTRTSLCELTTACAYFRDSVFTFRELYFPLFEIWGLAARADFAAPIDDFISRCDDDGRLSRFWRYIAL